MASSTVNRDPSDRLVEEVPPRTLYTPARLALSISSSAFTVLRPYAPQLIPIVFCFFLIPFFLLLSGAAGFLVWRNVAAGWESPIYLQFGDGIPPYALAPLPKFASQQPYDISLHLTLPATESNYALGNFMTKMTLSTPSNKTLISVRRPAIVYSPRSSLLRPKPTITTLDIPMLSSYVSGSSRLLAYVELGRQDGWTTLGNGEGREIRVIGASIRGLVVRHGIRGLVSHFPLTFALLSATTFFAITLLILGACILPTMLQPKHEDMISSPKDQPNEPYSPIISDVDVDEQPPVRRRRPRPTRSTSRKKDNTGPPATMIPSAIIKPDHLRRRRSRTLETSDSDP